MELPRTICYKNVCHYQSGLENFNLATNDRINLYLDKACISCYLTFHQNKALKKLLKMFFVSPKPLLWFLKYANFRRKSGR